MKQVSQLTADGYFSHMVEADESPLEPGVYLIPAKCIDLPKPEQVGMLARHEAGAWVFEPIPPPPIPTEPSTPPTPPTEVELLAQVTAEVLAEVRALRTQFFSAIAGIQSEATARGNHADALAIAEVQEGARNITSIDLTGCTSRVEIEHRFGLAWVALVEDAPLHVKLALRASR